MVVIGLLEAGFSRVAAGAGRGTPAERKVEAGMVKPAGPAGGWLPITSRLTTRSTPGVASAMPMAASSCRSSATWPSSQIVPDLLFTFTR